MEKIIEENLIAHRQVLENIILDYQDQILEVANIILEAFEKDAKLLIFGNGGSAADAQHIAAEFVGRFKKERFALPAISLSTDTSILTALSNDYSYSYIFARQVEALAKKDDILLGISTSGKSSNVLEAFKKGSQIGTKSIALLGCDGGDIKNMSDLSLVVPSSDTARIQEMHILIGHIICDCVEKKMNFS